MTIAYFLAQCKEGARNLLSGDGAVALIVILVGLASFGLGRLSAEEAGHKPLTIVYPEDGAPRAPVVLKDEGTSAGQEVSARTQTAAAGEASGPEVVASKNGTKYYLPSCSGVSRISPENLVTFPSPQAAKDSGYSAAANCSGL